MCGYIWVVGNIKKPKIMEDNSGTKEYEFFKGKLPNKTYVSKRVEIKVPEFKNGEVVNKIIPIRFASKVIDTKNCFEL